MVDRDIGVIEQIYSDGYGLVTRSGALRNRAERIKMIESGKLRYVRIGLIVPNQANIDARRFYHFQDDRLTLTLTSGDVRLTWKRVL